MRKSNLLSVCLLASLVGVLLWQAISDSNPVKEKLYEDFGDWLDQRVFNNAEIDARRLALSRFMKRSAETEAEFVAGTLTLEEAVEQVLSASLEHYPDHLDYMARFEKGATSEERIARNIIRHVEEDPELCKNEALRDRLQEQFAELLKKYQKPAPLPMVGALAA